ncbi:MAG: CorA family divalent cation transporter [Fimbriimonadales bacterium]|nr:CorA family divalent cation transporter [Fimbriimonadales bacterium]
MRVASDIAFVRFVYPFVFKEEQSLGQIVKRMEQQGWNKSSFPEGDLLPHVRDYLNPRGDSEATAYLLTLSGEALAQKAQCLNSNFSGGSGALWQMQLKDRVVPFRLNEAQLVIFRGAVAMLTLEARPQSDLLADWLDFIYHFRFYAGKADEKQDTSAPRLLYNGCVMEGIQPLLDQVLQPFPFAQRENLFMHNMMLPFSALYLDGDIDEPEMRRLLHRIRLCFASWHDLHPPESELRPDHPYLIEYAHHIWFTFSQQAAGFVAFNAPGDATGFFRGDLPQRLRSRYFLIYQLALHQKFRLVYLSNGVSRNWLSGNEPQRRVIFGKIRDALLEFTARGYFAQVMHQEQHHHYYCRWREVLQLEMLYQEVSNEVREMYDYLEMRLEERRTEQSEKLNRVVLWLTGFTVFFALPGIVVSGLGMNVGSIEQLDSRLGGLWWLRAITLSAVVSAATVWIVILIVGRTRSSEKSSERGADHTSSR